MKYDDDWFERHGFGGSELTGPALSLPASGFAKCVHKPLQLGYTGFSIHGGSCISPAIGNADVYIGFAEGMKLTSRNWPWTPGHEVFFKIDDMQAPKDPAAFAKLVAWTWEQLQAGLVVHAGCLGGHGRTGTFLAALVRVVAGEPDAITYVRTHYCHRAVESRAQIEFLHRHFGITKVAERKSSAVSTAPPGVLLLPAGPGPKKKHQGGSACKDRREVASPMRDKLSIWG